MRLPESSIGRAATNSSKGFQKWLFLESQHTYSYGFLTLLVCGAVSGKPTSPDVRYPSRRQHPARLKLPLNGRQPLICRRAWSVSLSTCTRSSARGFPFCVVSTRAAGGGNIGAAWACRRRPSETSTSRLAARSAPPSPHWQRAFLSV